MRVEQSFPIEAAKPARPRPSGPWLGLLAGACALFMAACASAPTPAPSQTNPDFPRVTIATGPLDETGAPTPVRRSDQGPFEPNAHLKLCRMGLSNAPTADADLYVSDFAPLVIVKDRIVIATAPANDVCFSSGFGPRSGRMHKGIDLISRPGGPIYAAAPGTVREARWGTGFGWFVTIDHGHGVYTRYAHLKAFDEGIQPGVKLGFGQPIGLMGRTGNASAVHLHYEVLTGRWGRKGSFGLTALDPLALPPYRPQYAETAGHATSVGGEGR